jgi:hypothetical protein
VATTLINAHIVTRDELVPGTLTFEHAQSSATGSTMSALDQSAD